MTSGIIEILIENSGVQTLVGQDDRGQYKVYPTVAPQGVDLPYVVVSEVSIEPNLSIGCASTLDKPRVTVNACALSFRETELIQDACRAAVDTGQAWTTTDARYTQIYMVDRKDLYLPATGQGSGIYVKLGLYEAIQNL